jgi:hypothetical protein
MRLPVRGPLDHSLPDFIGAFTLIPLEREAAPRPPARLDQVQLARRRRGGSQGDLPSGDQGALQRL